MKNKLVSIITPCFNGEKVIHRLLDSVLLQTYSNIEHIIVDDGSTDRTEEIILSYKERFEKKGFVLIYIHQENTGLGGAINTGLRNIKGEYLCWPDADDYFEARSIDKRVKILEQNPDYAVVTSNSYIREINNLEGYLRLGGDNQPGKFLEKQFELLLSANSMFIPGTHMVRSISFFETHPEGQIYPCRRGQNWQMLLPLYYKYKRYFLDEPLHNYIIYSSSMSQGDDTMEKEIFRFNEHEEIIVKTLNSMNIELIEKEKYTFETKIRYARKRLTIAFLHRNNSMISKEYFILKANNQKRKKEFIYYIISKNVSIHRLFLKTLSLLR